MYSMQISDYIDLCHMWLFSNVDVSMGSSLCKVHNILR